MLKSHFKSIIFVHLMTTLLFSGLSYSYTLTTTVQPASKGTVTVTPAPIAGEYPAGSKITLTANPVPGYIFLAWTVPDVLLTAAESSLSSATTEVIDQSNIISKLLAEKP